MSFNPPTHPLSLSEVRAIISVSSSGVTSEWPTSPQSAIFTDVYSQNIWKPHKVSEGSRTLFEIHIRAKAAGGHSMCRQSKTFQLWKTYIYTGLLSVSVRVFLILRLEKALQHWMVLQMPLKCFWVSVLGACVIGRDKDCVHDKDNVEPTTCSLENSTETSCA